LTVIENLVTCKAYRLCWSLRASLEDMGSMEKSLCKKKKGGGLVGGVRMRWRTDSKRTYRTMNGAPVGTCKSWSPK